MNKIEKVREGILHCFHEECRACPYRSLSFDNDCKEILREDFESLKLVEKTVIPKPEDCIRVVVDDQELFQILCDKAGQNKEIVQTYYDPDIEMLRAKFIFVFGEQS